MASKLDNGVNSSQKKKNLDGWKYPKMPIDKVYKKKLLGILPSYAIKDFEETITLKAANQNVSAKLLSKDFLKGFVTKKHKFVHLGLVQVSIKPLLRNGLGAPIVVSLRDARHLDFEHSLLALVEADLSEGPFYFNCFPSFSVSLSDSSSFEALTLNVKTGGIPMALTYRVVCKAMVDLSSGALNEPVLGETTYFQPATGTRTTTKWNEVQIPESWSTQADPTAKSANVLETLPDGRVILKFPSAKEK